MKTLIIKTAVAMALLSPFSGAQGIVPDSEQGVNGQDHLKTAGYYSGLCNSGAEAVIEPWMTDADYFYPAALVQAADAAPATQPWMADADYFYPAALVQAADAAPATQPWMTDTSYFSREYSARKNYHLMKLPLQKACHHKFNASRSK